MIGSTISHYRITEKLGQGGMGEVFLARDSTLNRMVALKFLPARFASDPDRLARFSQEARAASSLNHPNIVTIHEIGEIDRQPFIVMELVEGETLRALMARGPLPVRRMVDIAAQIADGLAKAHAAGIVHRDLKPENVMVSADGFAKILDFGLAKLRSDTGSARVVGKPSGAEADTVTGLGPETISGAILGTAGYMAPEQAAGATVDYRADQFSLGAILYEMATGTRAFQRDSVIQTLNAIIESEPAPLATVNPEFPAPARWIVERCLAKKPAERYASTLDLARELRSLRDHLGDASSVPRSTARRWPRLRLRLWHALASGLVIVLVVLFGPPTVDTLLQKFHVLPLPAAKRIAVLPVRSPGLTRGDAAMCDGMLDYIIARLGEMQRFQQSLWVVPAGEVRESGVKSPAQAKRGLGATLAVDLSVQRAGSEFVMTFSLADTTAALPRQLRGSTRRVPATDVVLDQAVDAIVAMLDLETGPEARAVLRAGGTRVAAASTLYAQGTQDLSHTPYERGLSELQQYDRQQRIEQAIGLFQAALARDPKYALAHAGLAQAYLRLYQLTRRAEHVSLSEQHCRRALELDTLSARPWLAMATLHSQTGKGGQAIDEFRQALDREPRNGEIHREMAATLARLNRLDEAEQAYRKAIELMPDAWSSHSYYAVFLLTHGRLAEAEASFKRALTLAPDNARVWSNLGAAYYLQDRKPEAETAFGKSVAIYPTSAALSNLATLQFYRHDYAGAVPAFEQATKLSDRDYRVWRNLAGAYHWAPGQRPRASAAFRRAAELAEQERRLDPRNAMLLVELAGCKAMTGDAAAARTLVREATRLAPEDIRVLFDAADVYETLGDRSEALRWLDMALARGYPRSQVDNSPSLEKLRQDPRYATIGKHRPAKTGGKRP